MELIKAEWTKIFKNKMMLISLVAILFVPIIYAGMFLWSFWDPYGHLDRLPVAVVNQDRGATVDGKKLKLGDDLTDELLDRKNLNFKLVSEKEAEKGMEDRTYYMTIRIPKDFSKNAGTLLEDKPEKLKIKYIPNEGINFLGSQIGKSAIETIRTEVNEEVSKTYAEQLFKNIAKLGDGFQEGSDGAKKLKNGAGKLKDGANELKDGIVSAEDGASQLNDGALSAKDGAGQLNTGIASAAKGATQLGDGALSAKDGASQLNNGISSASDGSTQLQNGSQQLKDGTATLVSGLENNTSNIQALNNGAQAVNDGVGSLQKGLGVLANGSQSVSDGVTALVDGLGALPQTVSKLQNGVSGINDGAAKVAAGTKNVADGTAALEQQIAALEIPEEQKAVLLATAKQVSAGAKATSDGAASLSSNTAVLNSEVSKVQVPEAGDLSKLKSGAAQVAEGAATASNQVKNKLKPGTTELAAGTEKLEQNWSSSVAGAKKLDEGAGSLNTGISSLNNGLSKLQTGSNSLVSGLSELSNGAFKLTDGMGQLQTGSTSLVAGLGKLSNGTTSLLSGTLKLEDGSGQLADGTQKLQNGAKTLQTKLGDASSDVAKIHATNETYDMVSKPVEVDKKAINHVENYGTGFAPYFISMGLLVGGIVVTVIFSIVHPAIRPTNGTSWFLSKTSVLAVIGLLQSVIVVSLVKLFLGIEVQNLGAVFLLALVASYTFMAIIQMFVTLFNDVGRYIVLILIVLQLTSSAGTFPLELIPEPLQELNKFMPMTYTIQAFKAAISTGDFDFYWENIAVLGSIIVVCLLVTFGYFQLLFKKRYSSTPTEETKA